jgi:hypothetical protein
MADLRVTDEIFARYPEVVLGVVTKEAKGARARAPAS